jgi:hypothetical protein
MAENDDVYIAENILSKQLGLRYPTEFTSRKMGVLSIREAISVGVALPVYRSTPGNKAKRVCLASQFDNAVAEFPPEDMDTSAEEKYVVDLLWASEGMMLRVNVIQKLKEQFPAMQTPFIRNRVFLNASSNECFFVAKGCWGQTVGLTREQALAALETITDLTTDLQDSPEPIRIDLNGFGKSEQADFDQEDSSDATSVTDDDALEALVLSKKSSSGTSKDTGAIPDVESTVARKSRTLSGDLPVAPISAPVARVKDERGNPATRNLYVYGYGPGTSKAQLKKLFSNFVTIIDIFVMKEGYSFVNTTNRKEAILARQQLTGTALNGGDIRINFAKD